MCESKQTVLIGVMFGLCIVAAIGFTAAYFVLWHYRPQPKAPPVYQLGKPIMNSPKGQGVMDRASACSANCHGFDSRDIQLFFSPPGHKVVGKKWSSREKLA